MSDENLISRLANQGAKPPLPKPRNSAILLCAALFLYAALVVSLFGLRVDFMSKIHQPFFQLELLLSLLTIISSITALVFLRLPSYSEKPSIKNLPLLFFALFSLLIFYRYLNRGNEDFNHVLCAPHEYQCLAGILIFSIIPVIALLIILRRGVVTNFYSSALTIGIGSGAISYLTERLIHETESLSHLFIWHFLPIFLVIFLGALLTKIFTKKL
jgi:hypothetical protein